MRRRISSTVGGSSSNEIGVEQYGPYMARTCSASAGLANRKTRDMTLSPGNNHPNSLKYTRSARRRRPRQTELRHAHIRLARLDLKGRVGLADGSPFLGDLSLFRLVIGRQLAFFFLPTIRG